MDVFLLFCHYYNVPNSLRIAVAAFANIIEYTYDTAGDVKTMTNSRG